MNIQKIHSLTPMSVILILTIIIPLTIAGMASGKIANSTPTHKARQKQVIPGFTVTAYCPGSCCNGKWAGKTCTGKKFTHYTDQGIRISAVDPEVIPLGTRFSYQGKEYMAADTGSGIRKKHIDILLQSHSETEEFGIRHNQEIIILR